MLDNAKLVVAIQDTTEHYLLSAPIENNNLVTLCVYGDFLFLKLIDCNCNMVVSTFSITGIRGVIVLLENICTYKDNY